MSWQLSLALAIVVGLNTGRHLKFMCDFMLKRIVHYDQITMQDL